MQKAPLVAVINDLSGFGRCSLTTELPILAVMGFQACPLPTAVLSNHTGYESCYFQDFTAHMGAYFEQWQKLGLQFAGVCTGFLGSAKQADIVCNILRQTKKQEKPPLLLVDPVMGDNGSPYATCDAELCAQMKKLVALADIITPNITEACLLLGKPYCGERIDEAAALAVVKELAALGAGRIVLTGVRAKPGTLANLAYEVDENRFYWVEEPQVEPAFAGAGDVFSAVLAGALLKGETLPAALEKAAFFVYVAAKDTAEAGGAVQDGINFEPYLKML